MKNKKMQETLDEIKAPEQLKRNTETSVLYKMHKRHKHRFPVVFASVVIFVTALCFGGYSWVTPVVAISVEADAEIALDVNCFDRIVNAEGINEAGNLFLEDHDLNGKTYDEAIGILAEYCDEYALTVVGEEKHCQRIKEEIIDNTDLDESDIACSQNREELEEAHAHGMSFGRYRAWKALQDEVSEEEFAEMDMQDIHDMMGKGNHRHGRN